VSQKQLPGIKTWVWCKVIRKIKRNLQTIYRKNVEDIKALAFGKYPLFVYKNFYDPRKEEIPIFVFHSVSPKYFEKQIQYLVDNNYKTLSATELYDTITGKISFKPKSIVLTFDDGRGSIWTTAYPILKNYGLSAICFLLPYWIESGETLYPTLENFWSGSSTITEIEQRESIEPLCNWAEIKEMQKSGVIDFQSHTLYHNTVFVSSTIVDFVNPDFQPSFLSSDLNPVIQNQGQDTILDQYEWGRPIYKWAPALSSEKRYIEDEGLCYDCINWVKHNGGVLFFQKAGWRKELKDRVLKYIRKNGDSGRFLSRQERYNEMYNDLYLSKQIIENKLNKKVRHLCYPWFKGSDLSVLTSKEAGYECSYWGILNRRATNPIGVNPNYLARMKDDYLVTLPGNGRSSLFKVMRERIIMATSQKNLIY
jgi:hypothetical protein